MIIDNYKTVAQLTLGEYKEKGSKFVAYAQAVYTMDDVKAFLEMVRGEHPKARHHCYAYRLGIDRQKSYRANDDGEPSGTAGKPILGQIDSHGLSNVMVIVVRYFGGTKLGVPGLIRSYKTATIDAFANAEIVEKVIQNYYRLSFDYLQMNAVMKLLKRQQINILQQGYDEQCNIDICLSLSKSTSIIKALEDIKGLTIKLINTK